MRIGFDIDGVLASFESRYAPLLVTLSGRDLFPGGVIAWLAGPGPRTWDWDVDAGYTPDEIGKAWDHIQASCDFWTQLEPLPGVFQLHAALRLGLLRPSEVHYITNRLGTNAHDQTRAWLQAQGLPDAVVHISPDKGDRCKHLCLDYYLDDKPSNVIGVLAEAPGTHVWLLDQPYNRHHVALPRVHSVLQFLERVWSHRTGRVL